MNTHTFFATPQQHRPWLAGALLIALTSLTCIAVWRLLARPEIPLSNRATPISHLTDLPDDSLVQIIGVVTFVNYTTHEFYVQDDSGGLLVAIPHGADTPYVSEHVTVHGRLPNDFEKPVGSHSVQLTDIAIENHGRAQLPPAESAALADLFSPAHPYENRLVRVTATVALSTIEGSQFALELSPDQQLPVSVQDLGPLKPRTLLNTRVTVEGVVRYTTSSPQSTSPQLWVASDSGIQVLNSAATPKLSQGPRTDLIQGR